MELIDKIEDLEYLIAQYSGKETISNNYLLMDSYIENIRNRKLFFQKTNSNLILLVDREISYQVYFLLNDLSEFLSKPFVEKPMIMEIVFRGELNKPKEILDYWTKIGFKEHLTRDSYSLTYKNRNITSGRNTDIIIKKANTNLEVNYIYKLFADNLDKYTGDLMSLEEIREQVLQSNILCAYLNSDLCGALHFENKNNVNWLSHIAVDEKFRGNGVSNALVDDYLELNKKGLDTRYQLWVINNNYPAINLYLKFGFKYAGKSTVSMLLKK